MIRVALLILFLLPGSLRAQNQALDTTVERVARAWSRADASGVTTFTARAGVSLDVGGGRVGPLGARQATAVLRRTLEDRETVTAQPGNTRVVGGTPARAFAEIAWTTRARGTTIPERATVFIAFVDEDGSWHITEIRLLK